jgi:hypothetical protein
MAKTIATDGAWKPLVEIVPSLRDLLLSQSFPALPCRAITLRPCGGGELGFVAQLLYNEVLGIPNEYHRFCGYFLPNSQALAYFHDT